MEQNLQKRASSIFYFLFVKSNQRSRTELFFIIQNFIFFCQLISIFDFSEEDNQQNSIYMQGYYYFLLIFRPFNLIHKYQIYDPLFSLIIMFCFELYFCYSMWKISEYKQETILSDLLKHSNQSSVTLTYCEWNNHFILIAKVDLLINLSMNSYPSQYISGQLWDVLIILPAILFFLNSMIVNYIYRDIQFTNENGSKPQADDSMFFVILNTTLQQILLSQGIKIGVYFCGIFLGLSLIVNIHISNVPKKPYRLISIQRSSIYSFFLIEVLIILESGIPQYFQKEDFLMTSFFICCVVFLTVSSIERRKHEQLFQQGIQVRTVKSEDLCLFVCQELQVQMSNSDVSYEAFMNIMGFFTSHKRLCDTPLCPCNYFQKQNDNLGKQTLFLLFKQSFLTFKKVVLDFIEFYLEMKVEESYRKKRKKRYTKALYELKKYQFKRTQSKICYIICESLTYLIELCVIEEQNKLKFSKKKDDRDKLKEGQLFTSMIESEEKVDQYKKELLNMLSIRNAIFQNLIEGYASNLLYQNDLENFIIKLEKIEKSIKKTHNLYPENVHYLKFLIMIRSILLNDPIKCSKFEKILQENITNDRQKDYDKVTTLSVMSGECISLIASYRNYQAIIKTYSHRTPQFFHYAKEEFSTVKSVNQLMPEVIGKIHDQIIKVMAKGAEPKVMNSFRMQFIQTQEGFIFPVKLFYSFYFDHKIHELLFSCFMLKLRNSYEYLILNKGGWIQGISQGFFHFLKDTLGYEKLLLEDLKNSNIVLYSTIILQYIANYENDGRAQQNIGSTQSYRMCIPHDFCGMLKAFIKMRSALSKQRLMMNNPEDEVLHKLKEHVFDTYYQQNVKTIDVQVQIRQETMEYEQIEDGTINQEKIFIVEFQGLTISRDSKSSINQSISMALQIGKQKTMKDVGKNKGLTVLSQLIKQAVVKQEVRKQSAGGEKINYKEQKSIKNDTLDIKFNEEGLSEEDKYKKRASQMIQAINEQLNIFKRENDMQSQLKNMNHEKIKMEHFEKDTTVNSQNSLSQIMQTSIDQHMTQSYHLNQPKKPDSAKLKSIKSSDVNQISNPLHNQNEPAKHLKKQKSKKVTDLQKLPSQIESINKLSEQEQLKVFKAILQKVEDSSKDQNMNSSQSKKKGFLKHSTSKFGNGKSEQKKSQFQTSQTMKLSKQSNKQINGIKQQQASNEKISQNFLDDCNAQESNANIGILNHNNNKKASYQEENQLKYAHNENNMSDMENQLLKSKMNEANKEKKQQNTYTQAIKLIKEKRMKEKQQQQQQDNSLGLTNSKGGASQFSSFDNLQEAATFKIDEYTYAYNNQENSKENTDTDQYKHKILYGMNQKEGSQEEFLRPNQTDESEEDDDDYNEDDEDDDDNDLSEEEDNVMSMRDINQTFSSFSEQNTNKKIFGDDDDTNASKQRTFGRNQQHGNENEQSQHLITTNIKIINKISNDPSPPQEIKLFGIYFFIQITSFIVFVIIAISMIYQSISVFQASLSVMWFSSEISQPINIYITNLNAKSLLPVMSLPTDYQNYMNNLGLQSFQNLVLTYQSYFEKQIEFNFQNDFKSEYVQVDIEQVGLVHTEFLSLQVSITNFFKQIIDDYYLQLQVNSISYENYPGSNLLPLLKTADLFYSFQDNITNYLSDQKYNAIIFNTILYMCFQVFTLFLFFLIFNGATTIKKKKEKLLKLISHITEREGQIQIAKGKLCTQLIKSQDQEYLYQSFQLQTENFAIEQQEAAQHHKSTSQTLRKKNIYLSDRINDQNIGIASSYLILVIMFFVCSIIGATGLLLIYELLSNFENVIQANNNFQKGMNSYYFMNIAEDLIEVDRFVSGQNDYYLFNVTERKNLTIFYSDQLNQTITYFTQDFLKLVEDSNIPSNYYNSLSTIVSQRGSCQLTTLFNLQEQALCRDTKDGLMDNGFQNTIINTIEVIKNRNLESESDDQIAMLFNNKIYFDENIISFLHFRMINEMIQILKDYTNENLQSVSSYLSTFYIVAGVINTLFFIIIFILLKIFFLSTFIYLRRGLLLLPLERAAEDVNVLSMIKSSLHIQV